MPLPPGQWSPLLVGDHWPALASVEALSAAAANRGAMAIALEEYADALQANRFGPLSVQQGFSAEAIHDAFRRGESTSRDLAAKNILKQQAYRTAVAGTEALREELGDIARRGNDAIERVRSSGAPHAEKVSRILGVIAGARDESGRAAATYCDNLFGQIQMVLSASRVDDSSRQFAGVHGFGASFRIPLPSDLSQRVSRLLTSAEDR